MKPNLAFQYCQKLVVLSADRSAVLLAKRAGEADFDGTYSFIGGKLETTDATFVAGMQREKTKEIGATARLRILPRETYNLLFRKQDGSSMILPHLAAQYGGGKIHLSAEYSQYQWVPLTELDAFEPKIPGIPELTRWAVAKLAAADSQDFIEI